MSSSTHLYSPIHHPLYSLHRPALHYQSAEKHQRNTPAAHRFIFTWETKFSLASSRRTRRSMKYWECERMLRLDGRIISQIKIKTTHLWVCSVAGMWNRLNVLDLLLFLIFMFLKKRHRLWHHILSVEISPAQNLVWGLLYIQLALHTLKENVMCYSYNYIIYFFDRQTEVNGNRSGEAAHKPTVFLKTLMKGVTACCCCKYLLLRFCQIDGLVYGRGRMLPFFLLSEKHQDPRGSAKG